MIETEQTVVIDVGIGGVWDYVQDIRRWASMMPGMQECAIIDDNESRWTLKVGVGGLVRTVKVLVHVDEWAGPERATFSYKLEGDPVKGGGAYVAAAQGPNTTEVTLQVRIEGTGPMAPMWEAMGKPLLPKFAKGFADQLKARIEEVAGTPPAQEVARSDTPSLLAILFRRLRAFWRSLTGSEGRQSSPK
jgi:carbon monoxide dehydrogenase subunit G